MTCVLLNKKNDGVDCFAFVFSRVVNQVGNVFVILNYVWWTVKTPFGEPLKKIFRGILPPLLSREKQNISFIAKIVALSVATLHIARHK